ncbi:hypothetical protein J6590_041996 [Homalodisca vitripennis]|nr:hypothetical protein J6590_041996 [Homalodisca vitripennis]
MGRYTKQKRQKEVFKKILGSSSYLNGSNFLAKGHLSPDADFIFNSGQMLTYYYVNAAPQWQKFNAGNWISVENAVRRLSAQVDDKLDVYTGTYGVLKLKNNKGQERMIYLEPTKKLVPVPEVFWKLVRHEGSSSCTVVVGYNNVFLTKPPSTLCSPADPSGWPKLTDLRKGYIYYCDYHSFSETVTYVPQVECDGLLEFPS